MDTNISKRSSDRRLTCQNTVRNQLIRDFFSRQHCVQVGSNWQERLRESVQRSDLHTQPNPPHPAKLATLALEDPMDPIEEDPISSQGRTTQRRLEDSEDPIEEVAIASQAITTRRRLEDSEDSIDDISDGDDFASIRYSNEVDTIARDNSRVESLNYEELTSLSSSDSDSNSLNSSPSDESPVEYLNPASVAASIFQPEVTRAMSPTNNVRHVHWAESIVTARGVSR
ncbi:MAG: hypothetical protein AB7F64_00065 [Gammaproteobacteria bacterium]